MNLYPLIFRILITCKSIVLLVMFFFLVTNRLDILVEWNLCLINSVNINVLVVIDWLRVLFRRFVGVISSCVFIYSYWYIFKDKYLNRFRYLVLRFVFFMDLLIFIPFIPCIILGWDGLGVVSFILVAYYNNKMSINGGIITILMNRIGDVLVLLIFTLTLYERHMILNFIDLIKQNIYYFGIFLVVFCCTKRAQVPFCIWLSAAIAAPTPVSALVHSSTLVTAGVYIIIRNLRFLNISDISIELLIIFRIITVFISGFVAIFENDLKKIIAYSTIRQLRVIIIRLCLGNYIFGVFHLLTHAIFKSLLFIVAGRFIHMRRNNQDIRFLGGKCLMSLRICVCFNIASFSLCGFPFLSGFYSKDLIFELLYINEFNIVNFIIFIISMVFTVIYSFRLCFMVIWKNMRIIESKSRLEFTCIIPIIILCIGALIVGNYCQLINKSFEVKNTVYMFQKTFPLTILAIGALIVILIFLYLDKFNIIYISVYNIFFLCPEVINILSRFFVKFSFYVYKAIDSGWLRGINSLLVKTRIFKLIDKEQIFVKFRSIRNFSLLLFLFYLIFIFSWIIIQKF